MRRSIDFVFILLGCGLLAACQSPLPGEAPSEVPVERVPVLQPSTSLSTPPEATTAPSAPLPDALVTGSGDGSSIAHAVPITGVSTDRASTRAEYAWLRRRYPGFKKLDQNLIRADSHYYDALRIELPTGEVQIVYFDITARFRPSRRGGD